MCTIYQRYATQPECAYDISKQAFLNILSCSQPYKSCFHNKDILIAYQRKVQSHSQGTNYKEWYKLQTIYILEIQIIFFHSKIQNIHPNIIYVCFVRNANCDY